jgi:hypothetical protein
MKKTLAFFTITLFLLLSTKPVFAQTAVQICEEKGGTCRVSCEAGETPQGNCGLHLSCCVPQTSPDQQNGNGRNGDKTINTAIGPIDVGSPEDFVESILTLAIGIGGGIATLLIIFGGLQVLTSGGNPEKVQSGKEMITSAISGLLLIVFAVFILRLIGFEILGIEGFR